MREYAVINRINSRIKESQKMIKEKQNEFKEANEHRIKRHLKFSALQEKMNRNELKASIQKQKTLNFKNESVAMSRIEEIHMRKETNILRKQDQREKMEEMKIQRQMEMLKVQAKHFGIEAKRNLRKVSLDHQI